MLLGCFSTLLIPETKRKTLEELAGEDDYATSEHNGAPSTRDGGVLEKDRTETPAESL